MNDFEKRLSEAIQRGKRLGDKRAEAEARQKLNEDDLRRLHGEYRLELSDYIEKCLNRLVEHFPGFDLKMIVDERGWGATISRDNLEVDSRRGRVNQFSRLEMVIRPVSEYFVLELAAKATIRNKEIFHRSHFQKLDEVDRDSFVDMIDTWAVEFAERYASG